MIDIREQIYNTKGEIDRHKKGIARSSMVESGAHQDFEISKSVFQTINQCF